jgi:hypothetical protein
VVPTQLFVSVAFTVNPKLPVDVGVPDKTPAEDTVKPGGNVPALFVYEYRPLPPLAAIDWGPYATLTVAAAKRPAGDSVIGGQVAVGLITIVTLLLPAQTPPLSVAFTLNV